MLLSNKKIELMFNALFAVNQASPNMDFWLKFKNKNNFKKLKTAYVDLTETFDEIFKANWKQVKWEDWRQYWEFEENKDIVNDKIKEIYDIEIELNLDIVKVVCTTDKTTGKTDSLGLNMSSDQMDTLEPIFEFEIVQ